VPIASGMVDLEQLRALRGRLREVAEALDQVVGAGAAVEQPKRAARGKYEFLPKMSDSLGTFQVLRSAKQASGLQETHDGLQGILFLDDHTFEIISEPSQLGAPALTPAEEAVLVAGGVAKTTLEHGPQLRMLVQRRTASAYRALLESSLDVNETAKVLGVNPSRIRQRLDAGTLYGIKSGTAWRLPRFQFAGARKIKDTVPNIDKVLCALPKDVSPLAVDQWFSTPNPDLCSRDDEERPMTPLEWLNQGESPGVVAELAARL
jgi:hypothetical protein